MGLRGAPSARVAIPQGTVYPDGLTPVAVDPAVQATTRPEQWLFRQSAGFHTIRPGKSRYQDAHSGPGIDFTPLRFAEDISAWDSGKGLPPIVSQDDAFLHASLSEIPGSQYLDNSGRLPYDIAASGGGVMIGQGKQFGFHEGGDIHAPLLMHHDAGDREPGRPLTRGYMDMIFRNPVNAFRSEYRTHPLASLLIAAMGVSLAYHVGKDFEGRVSRGGAGNVGPAAAQTTGQTAERGTNAISDLVSDAGSAVNKVSNDLARAVS